MKFLIDLLNKIPKRFVIVGFINTVFGYLSGLLNYFIFFETIGIIGVGIINNVVNITFAFVMFKKFVFKTINTNWFFEYLRS